ncbi:class I SAM-dependent methyltransferase [Jannaschia marina]|uniref:class I SAM-dependent methyltransferase n=1 Tax=Jannaschia marina TaxID=2741674 RepID=UPI0015CD26E0|nr:class I SAM-dependent methyltransferase [Jannaschia marina]
MTAHPEQTVETAEMNDDAADQTEAYRAKIDAHVAKQTRRFKRSVGGITPRHCPICDYRGLFPAYGDPPRFDARCPSCSSLERHRLVALHVQREAPFGPDDRLLHFSPEASVTRVVQPVVGRYETADISPRRSTDHKLDITAIDLPDGTAETGFDIILCSQILEHVDDAKALSEMFRILRPGGRAYLMTPVCEGWAESYENPEVTSGPDRRLHFGQADHVRFYGRDIRDRIRAAGFALREVVAAEPDVRLHGLIRGETLFIATKPAEGDGGQGE